ncbi:hypothetical protein ACVGW3_00285, partial [Enterobacter hormaechei]
TSTMIAPTASIEITDPRQRLAFIPELFFTPQGAPLVASWFQVHIQYEGGLWRFFAVPRGISGRNYASNDDSITHSQIKKYDPTTHP